VHVEQAHASCAGDGGGEGQVHRAVGGLDQVSRSATAVSERSGSGPGPSATSSGGGPPAVVPTGSRSRPELTRRAGERSAGRIVINSGGRLMVPLCWRDGSWHVRAHLAVRHGFIVPHKDSNFKPPIAKVIYRQQSDIEAAAPEDQQDERALGHNRAQSRRPNLPCPPRNSRRS
jgi:hypothetical protein